MSESFVGEIRMFAGNFAPQGWAYCDGQLLAISQNDALFSFLGTIYGGDGRTTFGLPDLRGRIPIHQGTGPGLSQRRLGAKSGVERANVSVAQLPAHSHPWYASADPAEDTSPTAHTAATATGTNLYGSASPKTMDTRAITPSTGGAQTHANVMPFLCVHFIISLFGIFPSRS
jgi:microcystin-dependent protein